MNIEEILDELDDMLEEAWSLPLSGGLFAIHNVFVPRIRYTSLFKRRGTKKWGSNPQD